MQVRRTFARDGPRGGRLGLGSCRTEHERRHHHACIESMPPSLGPRKAAQEASLHACNRIEKALSTDSGRQHSHSDCSLRAWTHCSALESDAATKCSVVDPHCSVRTVKYRDAATLARNSPVTTASQEAPPCRRISMQHTGLGVLKHTSPWRRWWKLARSCLPAGRESSAWGTTSTLWSASMPSSPPCVDMQPLTPAAYHTYPWRLPGGRSGRLKTHPSLLLSSMSTLSSFDSARGSQPLPEAEPSPARSKLSPGCSNSASLLLQLLKMR